VERVQWFRDRAARDRLLEEKEILEEEFERTCKRNACMADTWKKLSRSVVVKRPGAASYASELSSMYLALAQDCAESQRRAKAKAKGYGF